MKNNHPSFEEEIVLKDCWFHSPGQRYFLCRRLIKKYCLGAAVDISVRYPFAYSVYYFRGNSCYVKFLLC